MTGGGMLNTGLSTANVVRVPHEPHLGVEVRPHRQMLDLGAVPVAGVIDLRSRALIGWTSGRSRLRPERVGHERVRQQELTVDAERLARADAPLGDGP